MLCFKSLQVVNFFGLAFLFVQSYFNKIIRCVQKDLFTGISMKHGESFKQLTCQSVAYYHINILPYYELA